MSISPQSRFICKLCDYLTSNKKDFSKHLSTRKHKSNMNGIECNPINPPNIIFRCIKCEKQYKSRVGLWRHNKICLSYTNNNVIQLLINENKELINENKEFKNENKEIKNIIIELVKSNNELQKQMIDVCQKIQPINNTIIHSNSNNNSNNKTFNLQLFLNEECKDALNMSEFINSIELKLSDLENMGKLGYIEGMSNIIIKQLNDTDMYKRPVHCSDAKRETLYIKEENKWEKENSENKKMIGAVRGVDKKNYMMLNKWKDEHPKCMNSESNQCDAYMKLVGIVMSGDTEHINKVIKKVSKEVIIDK